MAAGEDKLVDLELNFAGRVKGIVVDESGKPVPMVYVRLLNGDGDVGESMTNANGEFDAGSMSGGDYRVAVYPSPMAGQPFESVAGDELDDQGSVGRRCHGRQARDQVRDVHDQRHGLRRHGRTCCRCAYRSDRSRPAWRRPAVDHERRRRHVPDQEPRARQLLAACACIRRRRRRCEQHRGRHRRRRDQADAPGAVDGTLVGFSTTPQVRMRTLTQDLAIGGNPIVDGTHFWQTGLRPGKYAIEAFAGPRRRARRSRSRAARRRRSR